MVKPPIYQRIKTVNNGSGKRNFQKQKKKGYNNKKGKKLNSQNPNCIKRKLKLQSRNTIRKEKLVEKKLSVCIEVTRKKKAHVTKKEGKEG